MLFIKASNPLYLDFPKYDPFIPQVEVPESIDDTTIIPAKWVAKDPTTYNESEKEKVSLDGSFQLIINDSINLNMFGTISHFDNSKQMWDHIRVLFEGTEEVREKKRYILVSQYEAFVAKPNGSITDVFKRYNKLINDLKLYGKIYETKKMNMKFLLTLPEHLESRISSLRERNLSKIKYDVLYGVLTTYELELFQKRSIQSKQGVMVNKTCALMGSNSRKDESQYSRKAKFEEIMEKNSNSDEN